MLHRPFSSACLLAVFSAAGCGGSGVPETAPVEGTVFYKGQPVEGANVSFFTEGAPRAGFAVTGASGEFAVSTFGNRDGAVLGDHVVTVSKAGTPGPPPSSAQPPSPEELIKTYQESLKTRPANELPARYASRNTSPLKFTVTKDAPNDFTIVLTD